jgi:CBS domain containing-hemolysin-like protein
MLFFMALVRPVVWLLKGSAAAVLRAFDVPMSERAQVHSAEELKLIATSARRLGLLPEFEEMLVHRALELDEVPVREIMTPRQKIFSLSASMQVEEAGGRLVARHHSRVPVYEEARGPEHIIGVVYARDLARLLFYRPAPGALTGPFASLSLGQVMRDVLIVPETKSVLNLIREFQQRRRHMAIVVDEYGSTVGLVTAEDAIEQLTGEFEDEFDSPAVPVLTMANGELLMDGGVNLRDLETQMQWNLPREGGVETLAGFLLVRLGHIPHMGDGWSAHRQGARGKSGCRENGREKSGYGASRQRLSKRAQPQAVAARYRSGPQMEAYTLCKGRINSTAKYEGTWQPLNRCDRDLKGGAKYTGAVGGVGLADRANLLGPASKSGDRNNEEA